jgi:hypothetical protein
MGEFVTAIRILTEEPGKLGKYLVEKFSTRKEMRELPEATRLAFGLDGTPWNDLLLAMCYQQLGETDKATQQLAAAVRRLEAEETRLTWYERLELRLLRREAERVIQPPP